MSDAQPTGRTPHRPNLLGSQNPTLLPEDNADSAAREALAHGENPRQVAAKFPASSLAWATLANAALDEGDDVAAYAFARTGYHRGLDALRQAGWRGQGPVPVDHLPNQGVLWSIMLLADAADAIDEQDEVVRCEQLLTDSDPGARARLS